ncbi:MAG: MBL fold metallo-hydrolase [Thermoleophilia bacterium]
MSLPDGITVIDTMLGGIPGRTAAHVVAGRTPAIIDPGAETSAAHVIGELHRMGIGSADLAWIVLTHIHLDHCGAAGALAEAFPDARVVVFDRAARHIAEPERLVTASHAVYGEHASMYGGLAPTDESRIVPAADRHEIDLGNGFRLEMLTTPGHARHHMSVLEHGTGTLFAGDALGTHFGAGGLYPNTPPSDADPHAGRESIAKLADRAPVFASTAHFGPVADAAAALELADRQLEALAEAALAGWVADGSDGIAREVMRRLPLAETVGDAAALAEWEYLRWYDDNIGGLSAWAERTTASDDS